MKHRKLIVTIVVIVAMAIAASAAYAWWTSTDTLGENSVTTGTMAIDVQGQSGPINVTGLVPSNGPEIVLGNPFALSTQVVSSEDEFPYRFFWIHNSGNVPEMFYAWAELSGTTWIADKVMCRIWLNPIDYPDAKPDGDVWWKHPATYGVWQGRLSDIDSAVEGRSVIRSITPSGEKESLPAGAYAVYKIVFWLDGSATNDYQGRTLNVNLHVVGGQEEAWGSW